MMCLNLGEDARICTWQMPDSSYKYMRYGVVAARIDDGLVITTLQEQDPFPCINLNGLRQSNGMVPVPASGDSGKEGQRKKYTRCWVCTRQAGESKVD
ncbi:MAG: hypothetical protein U5L96_18020 [Owenweeksia sp.]|nr:hypothetical protein [Owenweeksia sp.]